MTISENVLNFPSSRGLGHQSSFKRTPLVYSLIDRDFTVNFFKIAF